MLKNPTEINFKENSRTQLEDEDVLRIRKVVPHDAEWHFNYKRDEDKPDLLFTIVLCGPVW